MTTERLQVQRLDREHLPIQTVKMARYLIGKTLVHDLPRVRLAGRIVETEAYVTGDAAAHTFRGLTERNRALFLERGHVYVYFIYGNHFMLNISGQREGIGEGVLLRAIEPLEGIEQMKRSRGTDRLLDLARGPGRVWRKHLEFRGGLTVWICALVASCGWAMRCAAEAALARACALESARKRTGCCVFTNVRTRL